MAVASKSGVHGPDGKPSVPTRRPAPAAASFIGDYLNGGFGYDRLNGGAGADTFFHLGVFDHGSDWVQDYAAAEDDVLATGIAGATASQFQVNFATTAGAGAAGVAEAFVIYRPTGQILWALVDGAGQGQINLQIGGQVFDLLA
jgi:Ca2+-binding RTX toxin-like protein